MIDNASIMKAIQSGCQTTSMGFTLFNEAKIWVLAYFHP